MLAREIAELLLQLGRLVHAEGYHGGLGPAQWMALRFFARANPVSRTPSAFAEFQATTRGTASQAIKALETGGYLSRRHSDADGRSVSLRLTHKGKKALATDPFEVLVRAVASLDAKEQSVLRDALHQIVVSAASRGENRYFGDCRNCAYLGDDVRCNDQTRECLRFGILIKPQDADLLCAHFQPKAKQARSERINPG